MNRSIFLLLVSLTILLIGHGMQLSLLPLYARDLGWSDLTIGITGASYFGGFVCGCFLIPRLLNQAGYIRVYLCAAAVVAGVLLLLASSTSVLAWIALRFVSGVSLVAIYNTAEAWINDNTDNSNRGKVFSLYVIATLVGIAIGQPVLALVHPDSRFVIAAVMMLLSVLPLGLFAVETPLKMRSQSVSVATVLKISPLATFGVLLVGVVVGSVWTMAPLAGEQAGLGSIELAWMMNSLIFGGIIFQYPLAHLVNRFQGPLVIGGAALVCVCLSVYLVATGLSTQALIGWMVLYGGTTLTLYGLCSIEANRVDTISKVEIAGVLLLSHGIGSILGPLVVGALSAWFANAMFVVSSVAMACLVVVALWSYRRVVLDVQSEVLPEVLPEVQPETIGKAQVDTPAIAAVVSTIEPNEIEPDYGIEKAA